jgi:DNA-binding transcriptional regulator YiaG
MVSYYMIKQHDLSELRAKCDMTQTQFASLIGVSERMYRHYEYGQFAIPRTALELLTYKLEELGLIKKDD